MQQWVVCKFLFRRCGSGNGVETVGLIKRILRQDINADKASELVGKSCEKSTNVNK